jgi:hypothetical protein
LRASKDGRKHGAEHHPSRLAEDGEHLTGERFAFVPGMTSEIASRDYRDDGETAAGG